MGLRAETLRKEYPDLTDEEVARAYALKNGYHVVVMYEDRGGLAFKGLQYDRELDEVRSSPYISNLRVVYDDRQVESFDEAETRAVERAREVFGETGASHASTQKTSFWRRIFGSRTRTPSPTVGPQPETSSHHQQATSDPPWEWSKPAPKDNGSELLQLLRPSLPPIFAAVAQPGRDPVFILADVVSEPKWRGLVYLLFKYEKLYYSPEALCGLSPQYESISGEAVYKAPTIRGTKLKVGVYAVEREALVTELCGIQGVPPPLIKQVQRESPKDMFTVAYFCGRGLGVRYVSRDGSKDESPPMDSFF